MQDRREGIRCEVRITLQGAVEVEVEMCIEFWAFWAYMAKRTRGLQSSCYGSSIGMSLHMC